MLFGRLGPWRSNRSRQREVGNRRHTAECPGFSFAQFSAQNRGANLGHQGSQFFSDPFSGKLRGAQAAFLGEAEAAASIRKVGGGGDYCSLSEELLILRMTVVSDEIRHSDRND